MKKSSARAAQPLGYGALRMRWCGLALRAFLARWGVYLLIAAALAGAGSGSPVTAVAALAAWVVLPLVWAASQGTAWLLAVWCLQVALGVGLVWGARALLWPPSWGDSERALPLLPRDTLRSDALVVAVVLLPLWLLCILGVGAMVVSAPIAPAPGRALAWAALASASAVSATMGVGLLQAARRPHAAWSQWLHSLTGAKATAKVAPRGGAALAVARYDAATSTWPTRRRRLHFAPLLPLLWLPLWRGPAQRCGQGLVVASLVLCALAAGLAWRPGWAPWWLAAFVVASLMATSRVATLARLGLSELHAASLSLPISALRLKRARCALALWPTALGLLAIAAALLGAMADARLVLRPVVAGLWFATLTLGCAAEAFAPVGVAADKSSRWLFTLALGVALASEVTR